MSGIVAEIATGADLYRRVADLIGAAGTEAVRRRGRFSLVLTGGRTARTLYRDLSGPPLVSGFGEIWPRTDFFLGDERWVPRGHPDSNGGMIRRLLLEPSAIAEERIFLIPTGLAAGPEAGAAAYEESLRAYFTGKPAGQSGFPQFDLVLLSMGEDGHVASLFPDHEALAERKRWVTVSSPPPSQAPPVSRITMTLPVFNRARQVIIMAAGREKAALARRITAGGPDSANLYPAGMINSAGSTVWLLADN